VHVRWPYSLNWRNQYLHRIDGVKTSEKGTLSKEMMVPQRT
jgi:hypothetical protein